MRTRTRCQVAAISVILIIAYHGSAQALTEAEAKKILAMHPDQKLLAELQKEFPVFNTLVEQKKPPAGATHDSTDAAKTAQASANADPNPQVANAPALPIKFLLRNSWSDLGLLGSCFGGGGVSTDKAKGASLSFTQDNVANNKIWAAQAMGAAVYSDCDLSLRPKPGGGDSGFVEKSLSVYAQVNSNYNSNSTLASKNSDTRTFGLAGELAYLSKGDYDVFRIAPNVVQDNIKDTTAVAVMGQYIPVWVSRDGIWHTTYLFGGTVSYQFDPTLDFQYASTTDQKHPLLFSGKDQSLRVGPELTLIVQPFTGSNDFLSRIGIQETFHPWYETYSSTGSYWWANSITYNLTSDGNIAVGFSYNRGLDENSGAMTNQYVMSLNGKL